MLVTVYTKTGCPFCVEALEILKKKSGIKIKEISVTDDKQKTEEMISRSGGRRTAPQIFFEDRHIGDCSMLKDLERTGALDVMIKLKKNK